MAELLDDRPGALWTLKAIDADRVRRCPRSLALSWAPIQPSPAATIRTEWGILVCGHRTESHGQPWPPHFYVIDDLSGKYSPNEQRSGWFKATRTYRADRIVAEINNGGDLVEAVLRNVDHNSPTRACMPSPAS